MQCLIDVAPKIYRAILIDRVIDEHTAIAPWMPWIVDYSAFGNMGISLCVCLTAIAHMWGWEANCRNQALTDRRH